MQVIKNISELAAFLSGSKTVVLHSGVAEPQLIGEQLCDGAAAWPGLEIETLMPSGPCPYVDESSFVCRTLLPGAGLRKAVNEGKAEIIRQSLYEHALALQFGTHRVDVLVLQVTPPDHQNRVSLGPCVAFMPEILDQSPVVIGVINSNLPRTNYTIALSRLDYVLHHDTGLPEVPSAPASSVDQRIAGHALPLLMDGATLEFGIGAAPEAVLCSVAHLKNIKIHTGLINDSVKAVVEAGAVISPVVTTMAMGSREFYRWLDRNERVDFQPVSHTHSPDLIAQIPNFCAINGALQVDMMGNVNTERVNGRLISCPGGLPDFARGAQRSKGGKSIIVLRSTAGRDAGSTIVPEVERKTLDGRFVDAVVTEHGVAELTGRNAAERAAALSAIAHPDHR